MIWVVFALFTGAAVFAVLWPLSRTPANQDPRELDVAFYRAQTAEIDRDLVRGVIAPREAEAAKVEAARRLVAANGRDEAPARSRSIWLPRSVALATLVLVPAVTLVLYQRVGAPNLPDDPLEARLNAAPSKMDLPTMIAKIERNVAKNPNDARGWALLARIYAQLNRPEASATAYRNEIRLLGPNEERLSGLGEVETMVAGGKISPEAAQDFQRAAALDPKAPRPQYYLGMLAEQNGDKPKAIALWTNLLAASPADAAWVPMVRDHLLAAGGSVPAQSAPAETAVADNPAGDAAAQAKMAAAVEAMPADQQRATINGMVDRLAQRLKSNGADIDGWLRLVRAYRVLDENDKAKVALTDARRKFATDAMATKRLDDLAHELGLEG